MFGMALDSGECSLKMLLYFTRVRFDATTFHLASIYSSVVSPHLLRWMWKHTNCVVNAHTTRLIRPRVHAKA